MKTVRTIIIDDEQLARNIVREYLDDHPEIEVLAECSNGFEAVKAISELQPDLVFLDIQMPKIDGFEVLELLSERPEVIFITAYDQYALKAFEVHAVDYLLKPFSKERFDEAVAKVQKRRDEKPVGKVEALLRESKKLKQSSDRILVKDGANVHVIPFESIDYIEAKDDYVSINTAGKSYLKQYRLSNLESEIDGARFVRIHRSYILNIDRIARIELYAKDSRIVVLRNGVKLPVSRSGYLKLRELLR
jgi:two-component system, LytTR family, response regulator